MGGNGPGLGILTCYRACIDISACIASGYGGIGPWDCILYIVDCILVVGNWVCFRYSGHGKSGEGVVIGFVSHFLGFHRSAAVKIGFVSHFRGWRRAGVGVNWVCFAQ